MGCRFHLPYTPEELTDRSILAPLFNSGLLPERRPYNLILKDVTSQHLGFDDQFEERLEALPFIVSPVHLPSFAKYTIINHLFFC